MSQTYVIDFYNLYIPRGKKYINTLDGITIIPLKIAEDFEKNRRKILSPYNRGVWKTAKCYIKSTDEEEAIKIAGWIEFLYSFAQNRSVFFLKWYKYKKGEKYSSFQSKFIEPRENRFSDLIRGTISGGFTRDIGLFIDTAIKTLKKSKKNKQDEIITTIHAYLISNSELVLELKFLIAWIALENLANSHYSVYKSKNKLFNREETKKIKDEIKNTLDSILNNDPRLDIVKGSLTRNFLYEHNTFQKISLYLDSLDLGFDKKEINKLLKDLIEIRVELVHNLKSTLLSKAPHNLMKLQKLLEQIIFRLLGIDRSFEKQFLINQYGEPRIL